MDKRKAAAEEATSATEGPPKEKDSIVMAKKEGRTLDAKEETHAAEAKKGIPTVEPSSDPSFPTEEGGVKPHATSIQELGFTCNLEDFLNKLLKTASHIPPSTDKKLKSEEIPSITSGTNNTRTYVLIPRHGTCGINRREWFGIRIFGKWSIVIHRGGGIFHS